MASPNLLPTNTISPNDVSVDLLSKILGVGWEKQIFDGSGTDAASSMLFPILATFNNTALFAVSVLFCWIMAQGIVGTAHHGEVLGKRFSSIWTPIRLSVSAASLAPIFKGLSILQVAILFCLSWSIQFADQVWETGLQYIANNGGAIVAEPPQSIQENTKMLANGILKSLILQQYFVKEHEMSFSKPVYDTFTPNGDSNPSYTIAFNPPDQLGITKFGAVLIPCTSANDPVCRAHYEASLALINSVNDLSTAATTDGASIPNNIIETACKAYEQRIISAVGDMVRQQNSGIADEMIKFKQIASSDGWITAGMYYWTITKLSHRAFESIQATPKFIPADDFYISRRAGKSIEGYMLLHNNLVNYRINNDRAQAAQSGAGSDIIQFITSKLNIFSDSLIPIIVNFTSSGDPVATFSNIGHVIIVSCETLAASFVGLTIASGSVEGWSDSMVGKAFDTLSLGFLSSSAKGAGKALSWVGIALLSLLVPVFCAGITFAYYLPSLPFLLWTYSIVGWLILCVESMVAAPLWGAAHAMPEGEGLAGQHGRQGYTLLLGVLVRPPLMIAGLMIAMVLIQGSGRIIGMMFTYYNISANSDKLNGVVTILAMTTIFGGMVIVIAHKLFGLVIHLPESVIRWVGQHIQNLGEREDEHRSRAIFSGTSSQVSANAQQATMKTLEHLKSKPSGSIHTTPNDLPGKADKDLLPM